MQRHRHLEFFCFFNAVEREIPAGKLSHRCSQLAPRRTIPKCRPACRVSPAGPSTSPRPRTAAERGRELFFSRMTRQRNRRHVFRSIVDLQTRHQCLFRRVQCHSQAACRDKNRRRYPHQARPSPCTSVIQGTSAMVEEMYARMFPAPTQ
jgi:hypothetical protein